MVGIPALPAAWNSTPGRCPAAVYGASPATALLFAPHVGNNPCNHTDPDGHCYPLCTILAGTAIGAIAGALIYAVSTWTTPGATWDNGELLKAAGTGAIIGGAVGLVGPPALMLLGQGVTGLGIALNSVPIYNTGSGMSNAANYLFTGANAAAAASTTRPGMNGYPDHVAGVKYVTQLAEDEFPRADGYNYQTNVSIKYSLGGIDRRPDNLER
jgi:hypothetical protein